MRALWHPFCPGYVMVLTQEYFQLVLIDEQALQKVTTTRLNNLHLGEPIIDFRFWPQAEGIRQMVILAVG